MLNAAERIDRQLTWLTREDPDDLIVLPTHLGELEDFRSEIAT